MTIDNTPLDTLAIIGTAGRRDDADKLDARAWLLMRQAAQAYVTAYRPQRLVSGGAAWADHLAVRLFLEGLAGRLDGLKPALVLHLPAPLGRAGFVGNPRDRMDPAGVANYYHKRFSERVQTDTIAEINLAIAKGAVVRVTPGFKQRNSLVAAQAQGLLAFTFGPGTAQSVFTPSSGAPTGYGRADLAGLKDGGTADTWGKSARARFKVHVPLARLLDGSFAVNDGAAA